MLLFGDTETTRDVHAAAVREQDQVPERRPILVANLALLSTLETNQWSAALDRYVVLGRTTRAIAAQGAIDDLVRKKDGRASAVKVSQAFDEGDLR
jgi:hypothetical protein